MEIRINIEKQHVVFLLAGFMLVLWAGLVWAGFGAVPNPGHAVSELQTCDADGSILKMVGGQWGCAIDEGSGINSWNDLQDIPAGFDDDIDNGVDSWNDLQDIPADFSDGVDDVGIASEIDPQVGSITDGRWCRGETSGTARVICDRYAPKVSGYNYFVDSVRVFPDQDGWQDMDARYWHEYGHVEITTLGPGYLLIQANGDLYTYMPGSHEATIGISDDSSSRPPNGAYVDSEAGHSTTNYQRPWAVSELEYKNSAGTYTYYIVGSLDRYVDDGTDDNGFGRLDAKGTAQIMFFPAY